MRQRDAVVAARATRLPWRWPNGEWSRWLVVARRRGGALAPLLAVAALTVLMVALYGTRVHHGDPVGFVVLGSEHAQRIGLHEVVANQVGYDGQFMYYLALHPRLVASCAHTIATCPLDAPILRSQRILYPLTARLVALGQPQLVPYALLLVNFLAIAVTAWLIGEMSAAAGASRWLGAAAGLFCGETLGLLRDLADPYGVMWLVLAIWLLRRNQPRRAALAIAAALLTREQLVLVVPLLAVPLVAQRHWRTLIESAVIVGAPFIAWQVVLRALYGQWALLSSTSAAPLVPVPFAGLARQQLAPEFGLLVMCVGVPVVVAGALALVALRRHGLASLLEDPLPAIVLLYCVMMSLTSAYNWADMWAAGRLAAPGVVLGVLVVSRLPASRWAAYAAMIALTFPVALQLLTI